MRFKSACLAILVLIVHQLPIQAQTLSEAIQNGTPSLQLRLSLERSDLADNDTDAATALNLRTRLGYRTGEFWESSVFLQFQDVSAAIDRYAPEDSDFDPIADPEGTSVHQAFVEYSGFADMKIRAGRQELVLEDGRLFSNADWRQHAQSFDAITLTGRSFADWAFTLGDIFRVRTVRNDLTELNHLLILQGDYSGIESHSLRLHGYLLDAPDDPAPNNSAPERDKATYGARVEGDLASWQWFLDYNLQTGYAGNSNAGGTMLNGFAAAKMAGLQAGGGYTEISGRSGDTRAFDTLFSTAHKFNGWSDQFGATNGGRLERGLKEVYVLVKGKTGELSWIARVHRFDQETKSQAYGSEIDFQAVIPLVHNVTGLLMVASYAADGENDSGVADKDEQLFAVRLEYGF
ncbi:MAG: alginate export family protein [SAR324 cluster bacterium]|nr:alginate export family protein [SAR324 cluster bacterium]